MLDFHSAYSVKTLSWIVSHDIHTKREMQSKMVII